MLQHIQYHLVLMVVAVTYLSDLVIWIMQIFMTVNLHQDTSAIVFGIALTVANFVLVGMLYLMCRVEHGYSVTVDEKDEARDNASTPSAA